MEEKVVAIFSAYIPPHLGGIERYIDNLSKQFVQFGVKPIIVTSNYNNVKDVEEKNGILIIRLPVFSIFVNRYPIPKMNKKAKKLLSILDQYSISSIIVNTRFHLTSHIGADYGYDHHIPVYLIEHGSNYVTLDNKYVDFVANRYEDFLTWKLKKKVTAFYGVSNACGEWLKHFNIIASGTWYNSIDCDQIIPKKLPHEGINFLYAGRLIKQKGVENILEAFQNLKKKYHNISLTIAGDGPEFNEYQEKYSDVGITFAGKLNYEELKIKYSNADVFLYPPLWPEGLPTSILEAGLMGCAVISTPMGGITEIIENTKNGLLVSPDGKSLSEAMEKMITDKDMMTSLSVALKKTINDKFSWRKTAEKVLNDMKII